jgi:glycerol-3-phosphate cytidylyltransferase-like family protein
METVRGCKWVDEIVTDVPYIMNEEYLKNMMQQHRYGFTTR